MVLLTVAEVADELKISTKRVYALIQEGRLRAVRLAERGWRVRYDDLEDFVRRRRGITMIDRSRLHFAGSRH